MSRSRKKKPIAGITKAETDKPFKKDEHSRERTAVRDALRTDKEVIPHPKEFGNPWLGPKDGKIDYTGRDNEERVKRK